MGFVRNSGVNYFKIDGVGDRAGGNVDALLRLTGELRAIRPDLFINITIGDVAIAILVVVRRFDLAGGRRYGSAWQRLSTPAMDHLS